MNTPLRATLLLLVAAALASCTKDEPPASQEAAQPESTQAPPQPAGAPESPERADKPSQTAEQPPEPPKGAGQPPEQPRGQPDATSTIAAPDAAAAAGDAASRQVPAPNHAAIWFGTKRDGVIALDEAGFRVAVPGLRSVRDMARGPDGTLWVASIGAVHRLAAGEAEQVGDFRSPGSVDHIAAGPDGALWATSFAGVNRYDGGAWALESKDLLGKGVSLLHDIAVDAAGRVWVASANAIHVREDGVWRTLPTDAGAQQLFFKAIVTSPTGPVYAAHTGGVLRLEGSSATPIELGSGLFSVTDLAVGPSGTLHLATLGTIVRVPPEGPPKTWSGRGADFNGRMILAIAADATDRTWAATDDGIVIIGADGKVTQWKTGTIAALSDSVERLHAEGASPTLPEPGPQATGAIEGRIMRGDAPVEGAQVEICRRPSLVFRDSPCGGAPFVRTGETGEGGSFRFEGVPLGTWRFAVRLSDKWTISLSDCCAGMKAGETWDAGIIDLAK